jgi:Na+/H+ antiporter NhaD/arsenite permease-like protein
MAGDRNGLNARRQLHRPGSIANLIVVQKAGAAGVAISFWDYFRVGAPLTIITLSVGILWLWL